jgi:hypothetical protein
LGRLLLKLSGPARSGGARLGLIWGQVQVMELRLAAQEAFLIPDRCRIATLKMLPAPVVASLKMLPVDIVRSAAGAESGGCPS